MAVPGRNQDGQVAYPELSALICGSCKDGEESMAVVGFCVDCNEYLCELCFKYHNRARYYAHHRLQDRNEMPCQQFLDTSITNVNICSKHEGERIRFYCRPHRELGCGCCIIKTHTSCADIVDVCDQYNDLDSNLKRLKQEYTEQACHAETHIPRIEKIKKDAVDAIKRFHGEIINISNKLENASIEEAEKLRSKDDEMINGIYEKCVCNLKDIDFLSTGLSKLYESQRTGELYMKMEEKRTQILQLETDLRTIHKDNIINECVFEPSGQLSTMLQCLDSLGTMVLEKEMKTNRQTEEVSGTKLDAMEMNDSDDVGQNLDGSSVFTRGVQTRGQRSCANWKGWIMGAGVGLIVAILISAQLSNHKKPSVPGSETMSNKTVEHDRNIDVRTDQDTNKPPVSGSETLGNKKLEYVRTIDVKTDQDVYNPEMYGLGIVSRSRLFLVDYINQKVKLLDMKLEYITSELELDDNPWDVTIIRKYKAAVTLPYTRSIQFVTIANTLLPDQKIHTRGWCYGITYWNNTLTVTCRSAVTDQWRLDILDLTGKVLNSIAPEHNGQLLFGNPRYVIVSDDQEFYVSDWTKYAVYRLSVQGEVKAIYKHPDVRRPRGLTLGPGGRVCFCDEGRFNGSVYQLDPKSDGIQKVLGIGNKVPKPRSVSYSGRKLYIGTGNGKVHVLHWK